MTRETAYKTRNRAAPGYRTGVDGQAAIRPGGRGDAGTGEGARYERAARPGGAAGARGQRSSDGERHQTGAVADGSRLRRLRIERHGIRQLPGDEIGRASGRE